MKKKSFLLSFFLAMLFVVLGSVNVKADETLEGYTYVNPMYEDLEGILSLSLILSCILSLIVRNQMKRMELTLMIRGVFSIRVTSRV